MYQISNNRYVINTDYRKDVDCAQEWAEKCWKRQQEFIKSEGKQIDTEKGYSVIDCNGDEVYHCKNPVSAYMMAYLCNLGVRYYIK